MNIPKMPKLTKPAIIIIIGILLITTAIGVYAITTLSIPTVGTITGSANLSASPSTIDWGTIPYGSTAAISRTVTITNNGGQTTAALSMAATTSVGIVSWDDNGVPLTAGSSKVVTFTLTLSGLAPVGAFSFNIQITG